MEPYRVAQRPQRVRGPRHPVFGHLDHFDERVRGQLPIGRRDGRRSRPYRSHASASALLGIGRGCPACSLPRPTGCWSSTRSGGSSGLGPRVEDRPDEHGFSANSHQRGRGRRDRQARKVGGGRGIVRASGREQREQTPPPGAEADHGSATVIQYATTPSAPCSSRTASVTV